MEKDAYERLLDFLSENDVYILERVGDIVTIDGMVDEPKMRAFVNNGCNHPSPLVTE